MATGCFNARITVWLAVAATALDGCGGLTQSGGTRSEPVPPGGGIPPPVETLPATQVVRTFERGRLLDLAVSSDGRGLLVYQSIMNGPASGETSSWHSVAIATRGQDWTSQPLTAPYHFDQLLNAAIGKNDAWALYTYPDENASRAPLVVALRHFVNGNWQPEVQLQTFDSTQYGLNFGTRGGLIRVDDFGYAIAVYGEPQASAGDAGATRSRPGIHVVRIDPSGVFTRDDFLEAPAPNSLDIRRVASSWHAVWHEHVGAGASQSIWAVDCADGAPCSLLQSASLLDLVGCPAVYPAKVASTPDGYVGLFQCVAIPGGLVGLYEFDAALQQTGFLNFAAYAVEMVPDLVADTAGDVLAVVPLNLTTCVDGLVTVDWSRVQIARVEQFKQAAFVEDYATALYGNGDAIIASSDDAGHSQCQATRVVYVRRLSGIWGGIRTVHQRDPNGSWTITAPVLVATNRSGLALVGYNEVSNQDVQFEVQWVEPP